MITKSLRSIFVAVIMGVSAYCGSLIFQCLHLWLAFVSPKAFRWYIDITMFMWICSSISLMEWIIGIKFRLYGDKIVSSERAIFIMNHRTRLDWLYFYGVLMRYGSSLRDEKIVLKNDLKRIAGPGWAMQCASYIFLERKLENDKCHLTNLVQYFASVDHNTKILLFPEGTDFCRYSQERSDRFADKTGLPHYRNVLYPRTAGFVHITEEMSRCFPDFDAIYDITAAYPDKNFATNEIQFIKGHSSSEVHFHCRRYSLKSIIAHNPLIESAECAALKIDNVEEIEEVSEKLKTFLSDTWDDKEKVLHHYYNDNEINDNNNEENECRPNRRLSFRSAEVHMPSVFAKQLVSVFLICGNIFACIYMLFAIPEISIPIFCVLNAVFIYIDVFQSGVDQLVMKLALKGQFRVFSPFPIDSDGGGGSGGVPVTAVAGDKVKEH